MTDGISPQAFILKASIWRAHEIATFCIKRNKYKHVYKYVLDNEYVVSNFIYALVNAIKLS